MPQLNWSVSVQVTKGPNFTCAAPALQVEAIDQVAVSVGPGEEDMVVELQPGTPDAIHLIVIQSSCYDPALTFVVSDGTDESIGSMAIVLDGPQIFTRGSAALFRVAPRQMKFTNSTDTTAAVTITVARDATPNSEPTPDP